MDKHCFINFAFIFCPYKLCILRDHKKEIRKRSIGIAIFEFILECEKKYEKMCFHSCIYLTPYGTSFYLRMCLFPKNSFMFIFSKTDAHVCFVMVPLNMTYLHCLQHSLFEHLFNLYY